MPCGGAEGQAYDKKASHKCYLQFGFSMANREPRRTRRGAAHGQLAWVQGSGAPVVKNARRHFGRKEKSAFFISDEAAFSADGT